jgi:CheY-like chemotaxis protein
MDNFILIVDDSPTVRTIMEFTLQQAGYGGISFANGVDALTWLDEHPDMQPAFVFLDIQMQGIDGYEWARQVKSNPRFQHTMLVLMSGRLVDQTKLRAVGITASIEKPFTVQTLLTMVQISLPPTAQL